MNNFLHIMLYVISNILLSISKNNNQQWKRIGINISLTLF
uniref:Uncharacterized protein n=1 Tax=viral metagenome TaxID=1070528 RepID=A0A6C0ILP2_9ZZZZ